MIYGEDRMDRRELDGWDGRRRTNGFRGLRTRVRIVAMGAQMSLCEAESAAAEEKNPDQEVEEEVRVTRHRMRG